MRFRTAFCFIILLPLVSAVTTAGAADLSGPQLSAGISGGMNGGAGFGFFGRVSNFAQDFPLSLKFSAGYVSVDPGSAADARRIFINDATNGIPEESGKRYDLRLDFLYQVELLGIPRSYIIAGPRYSSFTANFKYIGGNEDFDVTSKQWGFGAGLEGHFAIARNIDFVLGGGYDYFPGATLSGHDTSYSPDGDDVNPRNDYTYDTADGAINQPKHNFNLQLGLSYAFGR